MKKAEFRKRILGRAKGDTWQPRYDEDEEGTWHILGEDPNCDLGGYHHEPDLGTFEGTFGEAVDHAMDLKGFFSWGGGGRIKKVAQRESTKSSIISVFETEGRFYERLNELLVAYPGAAYQELNAVVIDKKTYLLASGPINMIRPDPAALRAERVKTRALAKLTPEERKALGL